MSAHIDAKDRFSAMADLYARYRPTYPAALFDWIEREAGLKKGARVVDVGCGTGISARLLADRGWNVTGVEPNDAMRAQAEACAPRRNLRYVKGEAAATGLAKASADLVVAAQALHWFDIPAAMAEFARILAKGGRCCAFWHVRAKTPFLRGYEEILRRFCPEYVKDRHRSDDAKALVKGFGGARILAEGAFPNEQVLDQAAFFGRVRSTSYVAHGVRDRAGLDAALDALFDEHQEDGTVRFEYSCRAVLWSL
ncbi:MAG TPA: class I SAM-dependent methyltransferase [Elusimicrobiota bacterium]|jgi:SAM-dependent methyltransferase|nr:class I SAM-dependent methyltransferase [Elusimicrobiota bacterium]